MPIFEPGLDQLVARNVAAGRLVLHHRPRRRRSAAPRRSSSRSARRRAAATAMPTFPMSTAPPREIARGADRPGGGRHQIDRAGRHRRRGRADHPRGRAGRRRSGSSPTPNSCARARRSRISSVPTGSSSAPRTSAPAEVMREIYRPLYLNKAPLLFTSRRTAELIKYAANAFLATKITFINEIADLCEAVGARRPGRRARHRPRQPDRRQVPPCRPRLWRLLLPQGHARAAEDGRGRSGAAADRRGGGEGERRPQARDGPQGDPGARATSRAARRSPCSA